jgi:hypothetical protein
MHFWLGTVDHPFAVDQRGTNISPRARCGQIRHYQRLSLCSDGFSRFVATHVHAVRIAGGMTRATQNGCEGGYNEVGNDKFICPNAAVNARILTWPAFSQQVASVIERRAKSAPPTGAMGYGPCHHLMLQANTT